MKVKPIFIIKMPSSITTQELEDTMKAISKNEISKDYHILVIRGNDYEINFECFYEKDFKQTDFEKLKKIVKK